MIGLLPPTTIAFIFYHLEREFVKKKGMPEGRLGIEKKE